MAGASLAQQIDGRVADNTLQQNFVFAIAYPNLGMILYMIYETFVGA